MKQKHEILDDEEYIRYWNNHLDNIPPLAISSKKARNNVSLGHWLGQVLIVVGILACFVVATIRIDYPTVISKNDVNRSKVLIIPDNILKSL